MNSAVILGAGDFAREIAWLAGVKRPMFATDIGEGIPIDSLAKGTECIIGVGNPEVRDILYRKAKQLGLLVRSVACKGSLIHKKAMIGAGSIIMPGAVVSVGAKVGVGCLLNFGAVAGHDCFIGECSVLDPGAKVGGRAVLGKMVEIGTNGSVAPKITVGMCSMIAIGSAATSDVPPNRVVIGVPGRALPRSHADDA